MGKLLTLLAAITALAAFTGCDTVQPSSQAGTYPRSAPHGEYGEYREYREYGATRQPQSGRDDAPSRYHDAPSPNGHPATGYDADHARRQRERDAVDSQTHAYEQYQAEQRAREAADRNRRDAEYQADQRRRQQAEYRRQADQRDREQAAQREREREQAARADRERREREATAQRDREQAAQREREREQATRAERERREREATAQRDREQAAQREREREQAAERERREREQAAQRDRERRERAERDQRPQTAMEDGDGGSRHRDTAPKQDVRERPSNDNAVTAGSPHLGDLSTIHRR